MMMLMVPMMKLEMMRANDNDAGGAADDNGGCDGAMVLN